MKKILYTILSIVSIAYIVCLIVDVIATKTAWDPALLKEGTFAKIFDFVVRFGGIAIIFCFALVNFTGNPLKTVFFILLILAIVCYVIVLAVPDFFYNLFNPKTSEAAVAVVNFLRM